MKKLKYWVCAIFLVLTSISCKEKRERMNVNERYSADTLAQKLIKDSLNSAATIWCNVNYEILHQRAKDSLLKYQVKFIEQHSTQKPLYIPKIEQ